MAAFRGRFRQWSISSRLSIVMPYVYISAFNDKNTCLRRHPTLDRTIQRCNLKTCEASLVCGPTCYVIYQGLFSAGCRKQRWLTLNWPVCEHQPSYSAWCTSLTSIPTARSRRQLRAMSAECAGEETGRCAGVSFSMIVHDVMPRPPDGRPHIPTKSATGRHEKEAPWFMTSTNNPNPNAWDRLFAPLLPGDQQPSSLTID